MQDTSIASLISAPELMLVARQISADYFTPFEIYVTAGVIYLLSKPVALLGARTGRGQGRAEDLSRFYW